jgi:hypothetical protein
MRFIHAILRLRSNLEKGVNFDATENRCRGIPIFRIEAEE